ncbi:GspE/PulE family protein [Roseiconus lacunae]|uniref:GspE/PulE family protein n=1 Tax=Roseiconus lacunae TaxID=2605694 RepID=A0ABT7PJ69_9BACT|nr:GspE/PulE family protein [Roseiconus lacunae]MCD0461810.1 GspE/PulE family protein [Roseiconus lacunae]MDM4016547.1 GspE/PulE family protein [Roseiconus lacunae]WRQ49416.1 GspE/PulE family protein [Stieleria sp. HD01]
MSRAIQDYTDLLLRNGVISLDQLSEAEQVAKDTSTEVGAILVQMEYATPEEVAQAMAKFHKIPYVDLREARVADEVIELVPESVARENMVLPYAEEDGALRILIADPFDLETIEKLRFILNRKIETALAPKESIQGAINQYYGQVEGESADSMLQEFTDTAIDFTETDSGEVSETQDDGDESSAPVIRLVNLMIQEAVQLRASDIHVEPFEERVRIRYRIDGVCVERESAPRRMLAALIARIKILSKIDISEKRRPTDGRIKITVGDKQLDLRVSIIPTNHGQSCVMRLLDKDNIKVGVRQLGLSQRDYRTFNSLIRRPNGIILVTGPTGSGKTTTLYAALNALNRPDRKIITAEDPVEYYLPGINQVEVRHSIGLDFARIIRSMLRQAPNIILVGEMRDHETASMGIQASLTGHLVFSTLHTNDAPSAISRMVDIGVPSYMVASSVIAVLAQRLVRTLCPRCKVRYQPTESVIADSQLPPEMVAQAEFARGKGCPYCGRSGYRGRIGIYELMVINSRLREMMFKGADTKTIRVEAIKSGMSTLYADGMLKVTRGITTFEEVYRVAKQTEQEALALNHLVEDLDSL